ncbi:MAG: ArsR family transcriptional regulator [Anaerolineae bacterium]|nr:ArsR family transcriptional regulator [Anaerolineae bacterium]
MIPLPPQPLPPFLQLLAHELRWQLVRALSVSDRRVFELVSLVHEPMNLVSYHLKQLRDQHLVHTRRSEVDGRDIYYSLDLEQLRAMYLAAGAALHPALGHWEAPSVPHENLSSGRRVLFVCTHNSARSQMAEGLLRHLSAGRVEVMSAGSQPSRIHPDTVTTMQQLGIDIEHQAAKPLSTFEGLSFDYVITVCDRAREVCPVFPGDGQQLHWGLPDPAAIPEAGARVQAFEDTARHLQARIIYFLHELASA